MSLYLLGTEKDIDKMIRTYGVSSVDWDMVSSFISLSEDFINEYKDYVIWKKISYLQLLSEDFIRRYRNKVYWRYISKYQILSEDFIYEYLDYIDTYNISIYQKLSENFIINSQSILDWRCISQYQTLSEEFIEEFSDRVDWYCIFLNQDHLSKNFIEDKVIINMVKDRASCKDINDKYNLKLSGKINDSYVIKYILVHPISVTDINYKFYKYNINKSYTCIDNKFFIYLDSDNIGCISDNFPVSACKCKIYYKDIVGGRLAKKVHIINDEYNLNIFENDMRSSLFKNLYYRNILSYE